ncbi:carbon starvation CstA family protein, partial [Staphylococcus aureus]|uniref:carbon starvation CstA family protein n=1 Tax=Staphylococcus aureus TaxID=1280 RepID=UPI00338F0E34
MAAGTACRRETRMPAFYLIVITLGAFYLGYRFYSKYLAERVYALDPNFRTP